MIYINSIDELLLWNWRKCIEGKTEFARVNIKVGTKEKDEIAWLKLSDEHVERFGLGTDQERLMELKIELAEMQCDYCIDGNDFILNRIRGIEQDITDIVERAQEGATIDECLMALSKWMGFRVSQKEITVVEFQTYLNAFQKEGKENKPKKTG